MEFPHALVWWPYLVSLLSVIIYGFPLQNDDSMPVSCLRWKNTDVRLCIDGHGNLRIDEFQPSEAVAQFLPENIPQNLPSIPLRLHDRGGLLPLTIKRTLGGPNYRQKLMGATKPMYVVKKPFDSITYNHDLAGFK